MKRHEHHGVRLGVIVIDIGHECDFFEEARKGCVLIFGLIGDKVRDKLGDVFDSLTALFLICFQVLNIVGFIENLFKQLLYRDFVNKSVQLLYHFGKGKKLTARTLECFVFVRMRNDLKDAHTESGCDFESLIDRRIADAPFRDIDDS